MLKSPNFCENTKKRPKLGEIGSSFEAKIVMIDCSKVSHDIFTTKTVEFCHKRGYNFYDPIKHCAQGER